MCNVELTYNLEHRYQVFRGSVGWATRTRKAIEARLPYADVTQIDEQVYFYSERDVTNVVTPLMGADMEHEWRYDVFGLDELAPACADKVHDDLYARLNKPYTDIESDLWTFYISASQDIEDLLIGVLDAVNDALENGVPYGEGYENVPYC